MNNLKDVKHRNDIRNVIAQMNNPICCEVGVRTGNFFKFLCAPNVKEIYAVDIWKDTGDVAQNDLGFTQNELDNQYIDFCNRYKSDQKVKVIRDWSVDASKQFDDNFFDFIYIDADHSYDGVISDLRAWYPKLKQNGIMGGHDYKERLKILPNGKKMEYGVIPAVQDFIKENPSVKIHLTLEDFASYFFIK